MPRLTSFRAMYQTPNAQITNRPASVSNVTSGPKNDQVAFTRSLACSTRSLARRNRSISRRSWANALTTRTPGMVSASTLVSSDQARPPC